MDWRGLTTGYRILGADSQASQDNRPSQKVYLVWFLRPACNKNLAATAAPGLFLHPDHAAEHRLSLRILGGPQVAHCRSQIRLAHHRLNGSQVEHVGSYQFGAVRRTELMLKPVLALPGPLRVFRKAAFAFSTFQIGDSELLLERAQPPIAETCAGAIPASITPADAMPL